MKKIKAIHLRRLNQVGFFLIFLVLFLNARDPLYKLLPPDLLLRIDPLGAGLVSIAQRSLVLTFWPALFVLTLSFFFGRSFCGWVCPLGVCLDGWNRLFPHGRRRGDRRWKYALLFGLAFLALFSLQAAWLLDPLVIFNRTLTIALYPLSVWGLNGILTAGFGWSGSEGIALFLTNLMQGWVLPLQPFQTTTLTITLAFFIGILGLEQFGRHYWCRVLCPLGALLGLISRISPFGRKVSDLCTSCTLCETECRMEAIEADFIRTRRSECILCLECAGLCAVGGTTYTWGYQFGRQATFDLSRRQTLGTVAASFALAGVWRTSLKDRTAEGYLIRPPGSVTEDRFLDLCLRCQECVKACSSTGRCLQPASLDYGWDKFWTPQARMREGYCEYSCTLCGQVCPSGAIKPLTEDEKKQKIIGLAYINRSRCLPWVQGVDCIVCEEHCPTPVKAIQFRLGDVSLHDTIKSAVKLPYVLTNLCIGCGICETKCPVSGDSAIRVTHEGEQRGVES